MNGIRALAAISILLAAGCSGPQPESPGAGAGQEQAPVSAEQLDTVTPEAEAGNILEYSSLDTCDGVFEGSYEEEHGEITVRATVFVRLSDCRVSEIIFSDSAHLNSEALRVIPQRIIKEQTLPVEAVTGASSSSWIIMTATALALEIDLMEIEAEQEEEGDN
ncbi:MAG: hypothetical protein U9P14_04760 [Gemmatimonadota bacterium]|nr:hypothetical protein [Gemmatimonadota bacterium]